jgi:hypothetical protein
MPARLQYGDAQEILATTFHEVPTRQANSYKGAENKSDDDPAI